MLIHAEQLRRQIQSAERNLMSNSAPGMKQQNCSASPARQAAKRRHTAAFASEGDISPRKDVKRTKSLETYGVSRRQLEPSDDDAFSKFQDDNGPITTTSQSVRFPDHSGHQSSMPLPAGSLQTDFLNHEPAVMFKDTGDTVADASSEQQRQMNQMMASKRAFSTSVTRDVQQEADHQSSSIPWTASDIANSARSKRTGKSVDSADGAGNNGDELSGSNETPLHDNQAGVQHPAPVASESGDTEVPDFDNITKQAEAPLLKPKSSPMVEIPRQPCQKKVVEDAGTKKARRDSKGRNKKVDDDGSEPLNSDDRAVGLPKERYQPRPSRRRATQVIEEPTDYSILPEKAAKVKRAKTTGAKSLVATAQEDTDASRDTKSGLSPLDHSKDGRAGNNQNKQDSLRETDLAHAKDNESPVKPRRAIKQHDPDHPHPSNTPVKDQSTSPTKSQVASQNNEDKIFVKPAVPAPKTNSSSKAKRARTTIFEDHVEFLGSRRSPNLSQQQAERQSALQIVKNEAVPKPARKRKTVLMEDSDDEDELARADEPITSKEELPPKKRRARPRKAENKTQAKAADAGLEDSDKEVEDEEQIEADQAAVEDRPKKRGRGRPPKAASKTTPEGDKRPDGAQGSDEAEKPQDDGTGLAPPALQPASTPSKPSASANEMPTPSPEQPVEKTKSTPQKTASSTAQHSPIKSNSKVPLRVGLSKRSRIQPLLRMMRPPKR